MNYTQSFISFKAPNYFQGKVGNIDCEHQGGMNIWDKTQCEEACNELGITITALRDKGFCFVSGRNTCRKRGQVGDNTSRVCKKAGTTYALHIG